MKLKDNERKALIGTVIFHLILLAGFLFFKLSTSLPLPGEQGVEISLGTTTKGFGSIKKSTPPASIPEEKTQTPIQEETDYATQETEPAPVIDDKQTEKPEDITEETIEQPQENKETEPKINPRALYTGKKDGNKKEEGKGNEGIQGQQGAQTGSEDSDNILGRGGTGNDISYSLSGRGPKFLPKPAYTSQEQGKVVVTIWVNQYGKVIKAVDGAKGTTISDLGLRARAKEAALKAKFSADPNAPDVQKGTITYNFIRLH